LAKEDKIISFIEIKTITFAQDEGYLPKDKVNLSSKKAKIRYLKNTVC